MRVHQVTCPKCGARTRFTDLTHRVVGCVRQHHVCASCCFQFIVEEDPHFNGEIDASGA